LLIGGSQSYVTVVTFHSHLRSDICWTNVMMDTSLCPRGMNPLVNYCVRERHLPPEPSHLDRIDVARVRYYLVDYGYSLKFTSREGRFQVLNTGAQIRLKEFYKEGTQAWDLVYAPHDPFKADVKQLGCLIEMMFGFVSSSVFTFL
jgi:hypothetical protein